MTNELLSVFSDCKDFNGGALICHATLVPQVEAAV